MDERISKLESEVQRLGRSLDELENRLASLEKQIVPDGQEQAAATGSSVPSQPLLTPWQSGGVSASGALSLVGRLFLVMAGAYLLRALTEVAALSPLLGVSLGLAYALLWLGAADRAAGRGLMWSSAAHGIAAALTAFPLLWEAVTRFHILRPPWGTFLLAVLTVAWLAISYRRRFQALAWFATLGAIAISVGLMFMMEAFVAGSCFLIVLGVITLWLGYQLEWRGLRWPVAFGADLAVLCLTLRALQPQPRESPGVVLAVQLTLLGLYLANIAIRTIVRARNVIPFEVVQVIAAFLLGFVGAVSITRHTGFGTSMLGGAGLILGAATYAAAFAFVDREAGHGRNFYFYTSLALLFSLTGSGLLLSGAALCLAWALLALLMKWLAWRSASFALILHATTCIIAAGVAGGFFSYVGTAFAGDPGLAGVNPTAAQLIIIAAAAFCMGLRLLMPNDIGRVWHQIQNLLVTFVLLIGIGAVAVSVGGRIWGGLPGGGVEAGTLTTLRTVVMALSALVLAWLGRRPRFAECGWLVYPVLAVTGLKILLQDFSGSRPATLFLALAVYGCALILSPRLRRG